MEELTTEQLEAFANNFDQIKSFYNESDHDSLLFNFQDQLKKVFSVSNLAAPPSSMMRKKLQMWKYNFEVFKSQISLSQPKIFMALSPIFANLFEISETSIKNWEKLKASSSTTEIELAIKQEELHNILLASEGLEKKINDLNKTNESLSQQLQKAQDELATTLEMFQQENKSFLHKIISLSKQTSEGALPSSSIKGYRKEITPKIPNNTILMNNRIAQGRELGFKQLKDTIEEVYTTKVKFDEKCRENRVSPETMDQFMYTYLNHKFGLKTIITEWTFAIMKAVNRYEAEDSEIRLFSKIIKHEVNEDFRYVFARVKEKIKQLLKNKICSNSPYMRESQIMGVLKEKITGKIEENEWKSIISSIYSEEESEYMTELIKENISKKNPNSSPGKIKNDDILYSDFLNIILGYDLNSHETLLRPFCDEFKGIDEDHDGLISQDEFKQLCSHLGIDSKFPELIDKIDPFSCGKISFSLCVNMFSEEKFPNSKDNLSILHHTFFSKQAVQE